MANSEGLAVGRCFSAAWLATELPKLEFDAAGQAWGLTSPVQTAQEAEEPYLSGISLLQRGRAACGVPSVRGKAPGPVHRRSPAQ